MKGPLWLLGSEELAEKLTAKVAENICQERQGGQFLISFAPDSTSQQ